jgi:hypothetical protein
MPATFSEDRRSWAHSFFWRQCAHTWRLSKVRRSCDSHFFTSPPLPPAYNRPLLDYLREEYAAGRSLILVTGADGVLTRGIAVMLDRWRASVP